MFFSPESGWNLFCVLVLCLQPAEPQSAPSPIVQPQTSLWTPDVQHDAPAQEEEDVRWDMNKQDSSTRTDVFVKFPQKINRQQATCLVQSFISTCPQVKGINIINYISSVLVQMSEKTNNVENVFHICLILISHHVLLLFPVCILSVLLAFIHVCTCADNLRRSTLLHHFMLLSLMTTPGARSHMS